MPSHDPTARAVAAGMLRMPGCWPSSRVTKLRTSPMERKAVGGNDHGQALGAVQHDVAVLPAVAVLQLEGPELD